MPSHRTRAAAALEAIERLACADASTQQVVEAIAARIVAVIDADAFVVGATDPDTGLGLGKGMLVDNYAVEACHPFWEHELLVPDYNEFADLTADDPVGVCARRPAAG